MKRVHLHGILIVLTIITITICVLLSSFPWKNSLFSLEKPVVLSENWVYEWINTGEKGITSLPARLNGGEADQELHISNTLPEGTWTNPHLLIRTSQQYMKVYLDDTLIFQYTKGPDSTVKLPGSRYHFIALPSDYAHKRVDIVLSSPYSQYSGTLNEIRLGNDASHVFDILTTYSADMITSIVIAVFGLVLVIIYLSLLIFGSRHHNILFLGLFSFLSGIWMLAESRAIELYIQNPILLFKIAIIALYLMPIPLLAFIIKTYQISSPRVLRVFMGIFSFLFVVSSLLDIFCIVDSIESLAVFHVTLLIGIAAMLTTSIIEIVNGNKAMRFFFVGCISLCFFALIDLLIFYFRIFPGLKAQIMFQVGMIIFIIITMISLAQNIIDVKHKQISHDILLSLAFTDILTGFKNRTAFEGRMAELNKNLDAYPAVHLIVMDINGLKCINDSLGHKEGDRLIIEGAKIIQETLGIPGELYRIGGDEFAIIMTNVESYFIHMEIDALNQRIEAFNQKDDTIKISIAYGIASYEKDTDKDLYSVFVRADKAMYICKESQKSNENNS